MTDNRRPEDVLVAVVEEFCSVATDPNMRLGQYESLALETLPLADRVRDVVAAWRRLDEIAEGSPQWASGEARQRVLAVRQALALLDNPEESSAEVTP